MSVVIETTIGDLVVDLYVKDRPLTCLNFLKLCKLKYYNLNLFHSVNGNFCAQTGDPTGKGDGGESVHGLLKGPEFRFYQGETHPKIKHDRVGLVSMVSHGQGMLGSQFVITLGADLGSLDGEHCVFGEVVDGDAILLNLNEVIADQQHRPYQDVRITHTVILEDPFPDPEGMGEPPPSPVHPSTKDIAYSRIPADESLKDSCTQEELDEMVQAREAAARATILEMVGDLPDADVAPPENVLFVCKLNPVTTDHDLSIIFSRFGKVKNCEVIRDAVSGDSLQYAFVEFEEQKACEEAYFKMDNVLIDDRRIHVDFSQSVARWRGKGKGVEMLGPTPQGGWGNKSRNFKKGGDRGERNDRAERGGYPQGRSDWGSRNRAENPPRRDRGNERRDVPVTSFKTEQNSDHLKNGSRKPERLPKDKVVIKKEVEKKKRRRAPSSSSSSESSDTTSSSESSESEPVKKRSRRRTEKVLVVVKTPRGKQHKKTRKIRGKTKKYESDSEEEYVKKKKKKVRQRSLSSNSSSEEYSKAKKKKRRPSTSEDDVKSRKKKKKKPKESTSDDSSEEEVKKKVAKKKVKRRNVDSSDGEAKRTKRKKAKKDGSKKRKRASSESESTSSSD